MAEAVSLMACLFEVQALLGSTWDPTVRLDLQIGSDLPALTCNRANLQNAIMNLLFNAREAMPNGGVISIGAHSMSDGHVLAGIEMRIADNGLGMTRDTMLRAFEPFFTTKATGLGALGLPIVKQFVDEAGGRLDIESEPGVGTTVTLRLPVSAPDSEQRTAVSPVGQTSSQGLPAAYRPASQGSVSRRS
jgi:signal transduction histidine kinase